MSQLKLLLTVLVVILASLAIALTGLGVVMSDRIKRISEAYARAEGWWHPSGTALPQRLNNPGNLKDSSGKLRSFATPEEGWNALYHQVELMLTGLSRYYKPTMTIEEIAVIYTGNDRASDWARIVSGELGVAPSTRLGDIEV